MYSLNIAGLLCQSLLVAGAAVNVVRRENTAASASAGEGAEDGLVTIKMQVGPQARGMGWWAWVWDNEDWSETPYLTETITSTTLTTPYESKLVNAANIAGSSHPIAFSNEAMSINRDANNECWVSIAGSGDVQDWIDNLNFGNVEFSYQGQTVGTGYEGFVNGYNEYFAAGKDIQVAQACPGMSKLNFVGYSRGAGIVTVLAAAYHQYSGIPVELYTFASPRALDVATSDRFHNQFPQVRVMNDEDVVTGVPFSAWGVKHLGSVICLNCREVARDSAEGGSILAHLFYNYQAAINTLVG